MTEQEMHETIARVDERTKNMEKVMGKLPCAAHGNRLTALETRIATVAGGAALIGGGIASVLFPWLAKVIGG